ncbi:MAG: hypothetical protein ACKVQC_02915 [Elusimicrobiota bacterium]
MWIIYVLFALLISVIGYYRLPMSGLVTRKDEVRYQMVNIGQGDVVRSIFETTLGKKRIFLVNNGSIYVSKEDFSRCHLESPREMDSKGYTLEIEYSGRMVLAGRMGTARILSIRKLDKKPVISK